MIEVTQYKLDNPGNKYEWWKRVKEIHSPDDFEKIFGVCGNHVYGYISSPVSEGDEALAMSVADILTLHNTTTLEKIADMYYNVVNIMENKRAT